MGRGAYSVEKDIAHRVGSYDQSEAVERCHPNVAAVILAPPTSRPGAADSPHVIAITVVGVGAATACSGGFLFSSANSTHDKACWTSVGRCANGGEISMSPSR